MKKMSCVLAVLLSVGLAHGAIFGDMGESGQFSRDSYGVETAPGSYWSAYVTSNAQFTMVNDGGVAPSNYVEMAIQWYPREASFWYVDAFESDSDEAWSVSADVAAVVGSQTGDRYMRLGTSTSTGVFDPWDFQLNFKYLSNTIEWTAGSQSGTVSMAGMSTSWTGVEISYDAATGHAIATFGDATIFDVMTDSGITINAVKFSRSNNSYTYDTGKFMVDNISASSVPEPATIAIFALGGLGLLRRSKKLKMN